MTHSDTPRTRTALVAPGRSQSKSIRAWSAPMPLAALVGVTLAAACVPATRYEEARSAAHVERAAHQRAALDLHEARMRLAGSQVAVQQRDSEIGKRDEQLAQSDLELTIATKERDEATGLVHQLRGELARVGDHLRTYSEQKRQLAEALEEAETRARRLEEMERGTARIAAATRDLTLLLSGPVAVGRVRLEVVGGRLALHAPRDTLLSADAEQAEPNEAQPPQSQVLDAVARFSRLYPDARFEVQGCADAASGQDDGGSTLGAVADRLGEIGVAPERIRLRVAPQAECAAGSVDPASLVVAVSLDTVDTGARAAPPQAEPASQPAPDTSAQEQPEGDPQDAEPEARSDEHPG